MLYNQGQDFEKWFVRLILSIFKYLAVWQRSFHGAFPKGEVCLDAEEGIE